MDDITPQQARAQLDEASTTHLGDERDALRAGLGTALIGVAVGGVLAAFALTRGHPVANTLTFAAYGLVLAGAIQWMRRSRTSPRGHARTYRVGFFATMALYALGIAWAFGPGESPMPPWALFGPYCVLVAAPMLVAGHRIYHGAMK